MERSLIVAPTAGQSSQPSFPSSNYPYITKQTVVVKPEFNQQAIPIIRNLTKINPDFGLALNNTVALANTGFRIFFDAGVSDEQADLMREHLQDKILQWSEQNFVSPSELVGKMFKQKMIGGAIANEWVIDNNFSGISKLQFLYPEEIEFAYNRITKLYEPYQRLSGLNINTLNAPGVPDGNLVKLNPFSFKYYGMGSDSESPYGIPPFLNALEPTETDYKMLDNIKFIIEQIGIWGFLEILLDKPTQNTGVNDTQYKANLENLLNQTKTRVQQGMRDGITVGFKDDTEFNFNSTTKDNSGVKEMYTLNWNRIIRGLNSDPALFGGEDSRTETQITIVFTKMLSELVHYQNSVSCNLEFGFRQELLLAGFKFKRVRVEFNPSTLQDALKAEQAKEIKIRNNNALYYDGIIDQKTYANDMGIDKPARTEPILVRGATSTLDPEGNPIITPGSTGGSDPAKKGEARKATKNKSAKDQRAKAKPQGNIK